MKVDSLGRRSRFEHYTTDAGIIPTPAKLRVLTSLRRRKFSYTGQLFEAWCDGKPPTKNQIKGFQRTMQKLRTGTGSGGPFVTLPRELNPDYALHWPACFALTEAGTKLVRIELPERSYRDPSHHRMFGASIDHSFEHLAAANGVQFRHLEEILMHPKCPEQVRFSKLPLEIKLGNGRKYEPDGMFGLGYANGAKRYFFREEDRYTETNATIEDKLEMIFRFLDEKAYMQQWGLPHHKPMVLWSVTEEARARFILDHVRRQRRYQEQIAVQVFSQFGLHAWKPPKGSMAAVYGEWQTAGGPFAITKCEP